MSWRQVGWYIFSGTRKVAAKQTLNPAAPGCYQTAAKYLSTSDQRAGTMGDTTKSDEWRNGKPFLQKSLDIMVDDALVAGTDKNNKIVDYKTPEELLKTFDFTIEDSGASHEKILSLFKETVKYSVNTAHPHYFNQLYAGRNMEGLAASWLVEALNANVHTYECAPVFSLAEQYVVKEMCKKIGYTDGDGIFNAGGSMCNFMGFHLARFKQNKLVKEQGMSDQNRQIIFSTRDAHYSVSKGAHFLGFGTDSVVFIDTDEFGCMIPEDLETKILQTKEKGHTPLCVMATSGTTVLGSFDPLRHLADVAHRHGCWLHVDACWGGGTVFSDRHRSLMDGVELTDSIAISLHKLMGAQIQCAVSLVREKGLLTECNATRASYLFQSDKDYYDPYYDIGTSTVQCGRKADGYKFWALWKARGHQGMQDYVDNAFEEAKYFTEKLKETDGFKLVLPKFQYLNISFWYIPPRLRGKEQNEEWWKEISKVAPQIKSKMVYSGTLAIGYQPMESKGFVNFFRIIIHNPTTTRKDLDFVIEEIHRLGKDL